jgi:hypothetical protein
MPQHAPSTPPPPPPTLHDHPALPLRATAPRVRHLGDFRLHLQYDFSGGTDEEKSLNETRRPRGVGGLALAQWLEIEKIGADIAVHFRRPRNHIVMAYRAALEHAVVPGSC